MITCSESYIFLQSDKGSCNMYWLLSNFVIKILYILLFYVISIFAVQICMKWSLFFGLLFLLAILH